MIVCPCVIAKKTRGCQLSQMLSFILSDVDTPMTSWFNENRGRTVFELIQDESSQAFAFFRSWSQNASITKYLDAVRALRKKKVEFFDFVFEPIGDWDTDFLSKCVTCMLIASSSNPKKKKFNTKKIKDGISFLDAWTPLVLGPLMEIWCGTSIQSCYGAHENLGREMYVFLDWSIKCNCCLS